MTDNERLKISNGINALDFIQFCKEHPLDFITYMEVIIDKLGIIYFANPSHNEKIKDLAFKQHNDKSEDIDELIDKYGYVAVWYDTLKVPPIVNRFQLRSLILLTKYKLITNPILIERHYIHKHVLFTNKEKYLDFTKYEMIDK